MLWTDQHWKQISLVILDLKWINHYSWSGVNMHIFWECLHQECICIWNLVDILCQNFTYEICNHQYALLHLSDSVLSINNRVNHKISPWQLQPNVLAVSVWFQIACSAFHIQNRNIIRQYKSTKSLEELIWELIVKYGVISDVHWRPVSQTHYVSHYLLREQC